MTIKYYKETQAEKLSEELKIFEKDQNIKTIMILACDANNFTSSSVDSILKNIKKPVFGGIFPGLIFKNKKIEEGFILAGFDTDSQVNIIENINSSQEYIDEHLFKIASDYSNYKSMFVFLDGLSKGINVFIEGLFATFGLGLNFIGGGAGSLSLKQEPCIITNKGLKKDCAVIAGIDAKSGIGVKHGWEYIAGPYKVTSSEKTVINELDFKPAFDIYKQVILKHSNQEINEENFFSIAKAYPFGINIIDAEKIVRDPISVGEKGSLICVGEIAVGSFVDILTGNKESLIEAAGQAVKSAKENKETDIEDFIFFVDCISRVLFLEKDFDRELKKIEYSTKQTPVFGILSIGEIANNGKDYLEFYNKTSVVGCF